MNFFGALTRVALPVCGVGWIWSWAWTLDLRGRRRHPSHHLDPAEVSHPRGLFRKHLSAAPGTDSNAPFAAEVQRIRSNLVARMPLYPILRVDRTYAKRAKATLLILRHIATPRDLGRFFSNRPFEVKYFQTIRHCDVDVAHGLALLFGIGTKALPSWDPRTRWNNLTGGLALPSDRADSPHPSSREGHLPPLGGVRAFLLSELIFHDCDAAGTASRVQRNSVPSTQMRCRTTASRSDQLRANIKPYQLCFVELRRHRPAQGVCAAARYKFELEDHSSGLSSTSSCAREGPQEAHAISRAPGRDHRASSACGRAAVRPPSQGAAHANEVSVSGSPLT